MVVIVSAKITSFSVTQIDNNRFLVKLKTKGGDVDVVTKRPLKNYVGKTIIAEIK